jgi:hypothetical protein
MRNLTNRPQSLSASTVQSSGPRGSVGRRRGRRPRHPCASRLRRRSSYHFSRTHPDDDAARELAFADHAIRHAHALMAVPSTEKPVKIEAEIINYVACSKDTADVVVVVAHGNHLRGVGTASLHRLADMAAGSGIRHFATDVLAKNPLMRKVLADAGFLQARRDDARVLHLEIDVDDIMQAEAIHGERLGLHAERDGHQIDSKTGPNIRPGRRPVDNRSCPAPSQTPKAAPSNDTAPDTTLDSL